MKIFNLVHAGGFSVRYDTMSTSLLEKSNGDLEMVLLEYNGRGTKSESPFYNTFEELVESLAKEVLSILGEKEPYCFYGHCMGGYAATKIAYYMQEKYNRPPLMMILSGVSSPHIPIENKIGFNNNEIIKFLRKIGGTEETVMKDSIFETELLPILKKDLQVFNSYEFNYNQKLNTKIFIACGENDPASIDYDEKEWNEISEKEVESTVFCGGHFFFEENLDKFLEFIMKSYGESLLSSINDKGAFPLTDIQRSYLLGRSTAFFSGGISTQVFFEFQNSIDIDRYEKAFNVIINRHPMLSTVIYQEGYQCQLEKIPYYKINVDDIRNLSGDDRAEYITNKRETISNTMFSVGKWPMFDVQAARISDKEFLIFYSFDMLIADGTSLRLIFRECMEEYLRHGESNAKAGMTFREYVLKTESEKYKKRYKDDREYWTNRELPAAPQLPYIHYDNKEKPKFSRLLCGIDNKKWDLLREILRKKNITPVSFFLTAYASVISQYTSGDRFCLNVTMTNRGNFAGKPIFTVGDFTSLLLLEIPENSMEMEFWEQTQRIQKQFLNDYRHRSYDGVRVEGDLNKNNGKNNYPIVFTSLLGSRPLEESEDYLGKMTYSRTQTPQVYLDFQIMEIKDGLMLSWDYVEQVFDENQIHEMFEIFKKLIVNVIENQNSNLLPDISDELENKVKEYNNTNCDMLSDTLHGAFKKTVERFPNRIAITDNKGSWDYKKLDDLSDKLAIILRNKGIKAGMLVPIETFRTKETIATILSILKIGAAYVPVDYEYPDYRKQEILSQICAKELINPLNIISEIDTCEEIFNSEIDIKDTEIAYVIFTSGSTGKPKGVVITHKEAMNTIYSINKKFVICEDDKILGISSMSFDLSVYDVFGTFSVGAELIIPENNKDIQGLANLVSNHKVTVWNSVPAFMRLLIDVSNEKEVSSLKVIMLSGDWIPQSLAKDILEKIPNADFYSLGGATEGSIWSIYYPVKYVREDMSSIPYGYPLDNQHMYVLNANGQISPFGVVGEIAIGGIGVAEGYYGRPNITERKFIKHPYLGRIYLTGDLGIFHREGYIEILGRKDGQMKVNGFRIEKGEIEKSIESISYVDNVVVDVFKNLNNQQIVAFIKTVDKEYDLKQRDIRFELEKKLPSYMIPAFYIHVEEIPLTSNGKVNHKELESIFKEFYKSSVGRKAETKEEQIVYDIFEKVLGRSDFGVDEEFAIIGIDSVAVLKIITEINRSMEKKVGFDSFTGLNTIEDIARLL